MTQKIRKSEFKTMPQGELVPIAQNVVMRMREHSEYAEALPQVDLLDQLTQAYSHTLAESSAGGMDRVALKNEAKMRLIKSMYSLADWLNMHDTGNISWFTNAGFFMSEDRGRKNEELLPPTKMRVLPQGTPGELELRFSLPNPRTVRTTGLEYSLDAGQSWHNGAYSSVRSIKLSGLPARQTALFRLRSIGKGQKVSVWTEPMEVYLF
jgi:hypothetical protein